MAKKLIHDETWRLLRIIYSREEQGNKILYVIPRDYNKDNRISNRLKELYIDVFRASEYEFDEFSRGVMLFLFNPNDPAPELLIRENIRGQRFDIFVHPDVELSDKFSNEISVCAVKQKPEFKVNK